MTDVWDTTPFIITAPSIASVALDGARACADLLFDSPDEGKLYWNSGCNSAGMICDLFVSALFYSVSYFMSPCPHISWLHVITARSIARIIPSKISQRGSSSHGWHEKVLTPRRWCKFIRLTISQSNSQNIGFVQWTKQIVSMKIPTTWSM